MSQDVRNMELLNAVSGKAKDADLNEAGELAGPMLINGDIVTHAFVVGIRDVLLFTP